MPRIERVTPSRHEGEAADVDTPQADNAVAVVNGDATQVAAVLDVDGAGRVRGPGPAIP